MQSFERWLYRLRAERKGRRWRAQGGRSKRIRPVGARVPWRLVEVQAGAAADGRFEIDLPRGHRLWVPAGFNADALRRLLAILDEKSAS